MQKTRDHISFSEIKIWQECPHKHKLYYIDGLRVFKGNEYTAFGKALHAVSENFLVKDMTETPEEFFEEEFLKELKLLGRESPDLELRPDLVSQMRTQGKDLAPLIQPSLKDYFGEYEIFSVEEEILHELHVETNFKGYIDLVVKKDDQYYIIDWKTCSWGWDARRKADRMTTYQLAYYKNFFCEKHSISPDKVTACFGLLKRTAKKNRVEIFEVGCGNKKIKNALKLMEHALYNIDKQTFVKNRLSCHGKFGQCEFYKTKHCR
jgi:hypothetical protein